MTFVIELLFEAKVPFLLFVSFVFYLGSKVVASIFMSLALVSPPLFLGASLLYGAVAVIKLLRTVLGASRRQDGGSFSG